MYSKDYLLSLKKEIDELEHKLKNKNLELTKLKVKRILLKSLCTIRLLYPYVGVPALITMLFSHLGFSPFKLDDNKQYLNVKKEIDSLGNVRYESQYQDYENFVDSISYYSAYRKTESGLYERDIFVYKVIQTSEENMLNIIMNDEYKDIKSLEAFLGMPIIEKKEQKKDVSTMELNEGAFLQATIYSKDTNEYIVCKESVTDNIASCVLMILVYCPFLFLTIFGRERLNYSFSKKLKDINSKYGETTIQELEKCLKLKLNNYNMLVRENGRSK